MIVACASLAASTFSLIMRMPSSYASQPPRAIFDTRSPITLMDSAANIIVGEPRKQHLTSRKQRHAALQQRLPKITGSEDRAAAGRRISFYPP